MLYSSIVLARNTSSILANISRLLALTRLPPTPRYLSTNAPAPSLTTPALVSALSPFSSSGSVGCLPAPIHPWYFWPIGGPPSRAGWRSSALAKTSPYLPVAIYLDAQKRKWGDGTRCRGRVKGRGVPSRVADGRGEMGEESKDVPVGCCTEGDVISPA